MTEKFLNNERPNLTPEQLRTYIGEIMQDESLDMDSISETLKSIRDELKSKYTGELLQRSRYWHAFSGSTVKSGEEMLPESTENGVGRVIEDLIERKLKPVLLR